MQNSSKVGFHYKLADISLSTERSIIATINGISQSTLLCTHLRKNESLLQFFRSQHNKNGKKRVICISCNIFNIYFQLMISSQDHQPCVQPLPSLAPHCWENPADREPRGEDGCRAPQKEPGGEDCSFVLRIPSPGLTREGEMDW